MRVLITGGSGLLGLNWALAWRKKHQVVLGLHEVNVHLANTEVVWLNLDDVDKLQNQIRKLALDIIIHTAGLADVDLNESNPGLAHKVNVELSENIAKVTKSLGIQLLHISTDHLFAGLQSNLNEDEVVAPINIYGKTKALAEKKVLKNNPNVLIVRTNFFGWGSARKKSLSDWILSGLRDQKTLNLFEDVYFTPILIESLAMICENLIKLKAFGVYNIVGNERISKLQFGLLLAEVFKLDKSYIQKANISETKLVAKRPSDMSLSNKKAIKKLGCSVDSLREQMVQLKKQEEEGLHQEVLHAIQYK